MRPGKVEPKETLPVSQVELSEAAQAAIELAVVASIARVLPVFSESMAKIFLASAESTMEACQRINDSLYDFQRQMGPAMAIAAQKAVLEQAEASTAGGKTKAAPSAPSTGPT